MVYKRLWCFGVPLFGPFLCQILSQNAHAKGPQTELVASGTAIAGAPRLYKYRLANGASVLALPDFRNPAATIRVRLNAGSRMEVPGATGLAHFLEHMLFRKVVGQPEGFYDFKLGGFGGQGNAGTSGDHVVYHGVFPGPALFDMMYQEAVRMHKLDLVEPYFSKEKGAVESERQLRYGNDPTQRAAESLRAVSEKDTPYEWLTIGTADDVKNMSIETVKKFYQDFYTPDNAIISVGGPFSHTELIKAVEKEFGNWQGKAQPQPLKFPQNYLTRNAGKTWVCSEKLMDQTWRIVFPSGATSYREQVLMDLLNTALDDHPEGPLNFRFVKRDKVSGIAVYKSSWQKDYQPVTVYFKLKKSHSFPDAQKMWQEALKFIESNGFTPQAKARLAKQYDLQEATVARRMTDLLEMYEDNEAMFGNPFETAFTQKILADITNAEFKRWVKNTFDEKSAYILGALPPTPGVIPCEKLGKGS